MSENTNDPQIQF